MKTLNLIMLLLCVQLMGYEVKMRVVDETGAPVAGALTKIIFIDHGPEAVHIGVSDPFGMYIVRGRGTNSVMLKASKDGYYPARVENLSKDKDHDVEVVLPRIVNPMPLYAWRGDGSEAVDFPVHNEWIGFDLEVADWIAPHGKGKTADILLRFRNEFKGWNKGLLLHLDGNIDSLIAETKALALLRKKEWTMEEFKISAGDWDGVMEVSFPREGEGMFEEKRFLAYSPMKLPHLAPEEGYMPVRRYEVSDYKGTPRRDNAGFFLRTRVKRDQQGRIVSANYAKLIRDFNVNAATGRVEFLYYFNPAPNVRNLEFDPKKNLFPKDKPGTNVYDP